MNNNWKDAVIDRLVSLHIYNPSHDEDPVKALNDLIQMETEIALDPKVSEKAQELYDNINWSLPQLQTLLRIEARKTIKLQIANDIVFDESYEPTAMDMEYWTELHEALWKKYKNEDG